MKYAFASFLALVISISSFSQKKGKEYLLIDSVHYDSLSPNDKVVGDSLLTIYHKAKHDTSRLRILTALSEYMNDETIWPKYNRLLYEKSLKHLLDTNSLTKAEIKTYKKFFAQALQNIGYEEHFLKNSPVIAREYYERALKIQLEAGDKNGASITIGNIGLILNDKGDIKGALEYFFRSLKMQEELHDINSMGYSLNNIASTYMYQGDTAKAMEFMEKSIKCRKETGDKRGYAISLGNIGSLYRRQNKITTALESFTNALKIWNELGEKQGIGFAMQNIGAVFFLKANNKRDSGISAADSLYAEAMNYFQNSLKAYEDVNYTPGITFVLTNIGNCYLAQNDISNALRTGERAVKIGKELGNPDALGSAARLLYTAYKKAGKWKEAVGMHELYITMFDSIFNDANRKTIFKQQTKYEYEKQEVLNEAVHQKELAVAGEEKKRQKIITWSVGFGLLMVVLFSIFIFNRLRITRRQKQIIEQQKKIVDEKNIHITDSINYAKRIQDSILPSEEEFRKHFSEHFIFFQPKDIVSGDFYWMSYQNEKIFLACADCTGHGVPGALMSMIGNTLLNEIVNEKQIHSPSEILNHLNEGIVHALHQDMGSLQDDGMDISICVFDTTNTIFSFAGANRSCFVTDTDSVEEIKGDIFSIGGTFGRKDISFSQKEIRLQKKQCVFLFTDGFADQPGGEKKKKFQEKRLVKLLSSVYTKPMGEQKEILKKTIIEWKGNNNQLDDMLVIGIKL